MTTRKQGNTLCFRFPLFLEWEIFETHMGEDPELISQGRAFLTVWLQSPSGSSKELVKAEATWVHILAPLHQNLQVWERKIIIELPDDAMHYKL